MSSKVNHALFDLVKSMTKSEKRYFKLLSSRHTIGDENNYVRIFDYLDRQTQYNEDDLFTHFKGEAFLNRFSITKKRLYDNILNALDAFHVVNSIDAQLHKMLHAATILFEKSLYDQSRRVLVSAEKLAQKNQKMEILLQITALQKKIVETQGYSTLCLSDLSDINQLENKCLNEISLRNELWRIKSELFILLSAKGVARSKDEVYAYKQICSRILNKFSVNECGVESKYLYYHILSAYYYATGELDKSLDYLKLNLDLLKAKASIFQIEPNKHFSVLTNAIYIADKLGNQLLANQLLGELKRFASTIEANEDLEIKLFSSISSIELSVSLRKGDFKNALLIGKNVEDKLTYYGDKISSQRRGFLEFKLAVVYIGNNDFNAALKWINSILNDSDIDKTEDIVGFTQLLDLLVHIELNHNRLLPYTLKNTQRFFKTRNRMYSFERAYLHFISKLIKCEDRFEMENLWEELYKELDSITADDQFESVAMDYFDFHSWAASKLNRKSFDIVVREKYNQINRAAS